MVIQTAVEHKRKYRESIESVSTVETGAPSTVSATSPEPESQDSPTTSSEHPLALAPQAGVAAVAHVVTSSIEHPSILLPLEHLSARAALEFTCVHPTPHTGCVSAEDVVAGLLIALLLF